MISVAHFKQGKIKEATLVLQESLGCARGISDDWDKSKALTAISSVLAKQGKLEDARLLLMESLDCSRRISDSYHPKAAASTELAKQGHLEKAAQEVLEIPQIFIRYEAWKQFVGDVSNTDLAKMEFDRSLLLKSDEAQKYYRKGWCENVSLLATDKLLTSKVLPVLSQDVESIEMLLQKYALRMLTLEKSSKEKINRLNRTLDIQWAIDIENSIIN